MLNRGREDVRRVLNNQICILSYELGMIQLKLRIQNPLYSPSLMVSISP
jgi:hypothetical protein